MTLEDLREHGVVLLFAITWICDRTILRQRERFRTERKEVRPGEANRDEPGRDPGESDRDRSGG